VKTTNRDQLELLFNLDAELGAIDPMELDSEQLNSLIQEKRGKAENRLSTPAQAILDRYIKKEMYGTWIDARWVQRNVFYTVELKRFSAEQIRGFLNEIALSGIGTIAGEDDSLRWYAEGEGDASTNP